MTAPDTTTTQGMVSVMQAAAAGKPLQRRYRGLEFGWTDCALTDTWDWLNHDYRIRPAPREWCLYIHDDGTPRWQAWTSQSVGQGIHAREVLE
jgi:hypothetical protein